MVLALAFAARAAVALSGNFILHPDEMLQYLEPAHRLVFGNGVVVWEYFYGARSWLVPGAIACLLKLFDLSGLGQPGWYVGGVKLAFCAMSLLIPAGMYFFARRHFSETAARVALLGGAFWYELVVFAHKPMTEFVASYLLIGLLALCAGPAAARRARRRHGGGYEPETVARSASGGTHSGHTDAVRSGRAAFAGGGVFSAPGGKSGSRPPPRRFSS